MGFPDGIGSFTGSASICLVTGDATRAYGWKVAAGENPFNLQTCRRDRYLFWPAGGHFLF